MADRKLYIGNRPKMKVSYAEKKANDWEWAKQCIDFFAHTEGLNNLWGQKKEFDELFDAFDNKMDEKMFNHITNPYNTTNKKFTHFPAKLRNFNLFRTNLNRLISEYAKRPFTYQVNVNNPDAVSKMAEQLAKKTLDKLDSYYSSLLMGEEQEAPDLTTLKEEFMSGYKDERGVEGQTALDYMITDQKMHHTVTNMCKSMVITGHCYSFKEVRREEVLYKEIHPSKIFGDSSVEFLEDGEYAVIREWDSVSKLVDLYYDELTPKQIEELEEGKIMPYFLPPNVKVPQIERNAREHLRVFWKALKEIGVLEYEDEFKQKQYMEVPSEYKVKANEKVTWYWVDEIWQGTRIGHIYLDMKPVIVQRNRINHLSECKLPVNGIRSNTSPLKMCLPWQILYVIVMYMLEYTMAQNKGKIILLDKGAIPRTGGWNEDQFFYYAKALGYAIIDTKQASANPLFNQFTVLDASTIDNAVKLIQLVQFCEERMDSVIGFTPTSKGTMADRATVGATKDAITQSNMAIEELFRPLDALVERDMQGLLDCSKLAWINGKKAMFIGSDLRSKVLEIDPMRYANTDLGINVTNSSNAKEKLDRIQQIIQPLSQQQGTKTSTLIELANADNLSALNKTIKAVEKIQEQQAQQAQQSAMEAEQQKEQMIAEAASALEKLKSDLRKEEMTLESQLRIGEMLATPQETEMVQDTSGIDEAGLEIDRQKVANDNQNKQAELAMKRQELMTKQQADLLKLSVDKRKTENDLKIAKTNKNKYDK